MHACRVLAERVYLVCNNLGIFEYVDLKYDIWVVRSYSEFYFQIYWLSLCGLSENRQIR